jgi:hypothetical protein
MPAGRLNPLITRDQDGFTLRRPALATLGDGTYAHCLTGQHVAQEHRRAVVQFGDPVALRTNADDADVLGWGQPKGQAPKADRPVCARPRISACTSCVPS